jgi:His-Xaa-Ser system protein HxsD
MNSSNGIKTFTNYVLLSKELYEKEPVFASAAKFLEDYYVRIEPHLEKEVKVFFKQRNKKYEEDFFVDEFCNMLIIEQAKYDLEKRFGNIRDMIVEQAFYPLEKK